MKQFPPCKYQPYPLCSKIRTLCTTCALPALDKPGSGHPLDKAKGPIKGSNPGPPTPKAAIISLDQMDPRKLVTNKANDQQQGVHPLDNMFE